MIRYSDNMTPAQQAELLAEIEHLDTAIADAVSRDEAAQAAYEDGKDPEDLALERDAAYEQSLDHLNRIAGDRK